MAPAPSACAMKPIKLLAVCVLAVGGLTAYVLSTDSKPGPAPREYVGQQTCVTSGCHEAGYGGESDYKGLTEFKKTMHQQIHLRPTPETVVIDRLFDIDTVISSPIVQIRYPGRDTLNARLYKSVDKKDYLCQLFFSNGGDSTPPLKIAFTYGGRGWIARYLVEVGDRFYVLPFQWVLPKYRQRSDTGGYFYWLDFPYWFDVNPNTQEGEFLDFNSTKFKKISWDNQCATCHINGMNLTKEIQGPDTLFRIGFPGSDKSDSLAYHENINIGCESCHGPGSEHIANPTVDNIVSPGRRSQFPRTFEGTDLKLDLCGQCHERFVSKGSGVHKFAYDEVNDRPFLPGTKLDNYRKDSLTGMRRWPDAFTSYAHHQTGQDFRQSVPYLKNVFSDGCWSCHTVHHNKYDSSYGGELPYLLNQNWYTLEQGKGCLASGCHPTLTNVGFDSVTNKVVNLHTKHSPHASQCVNCHFTKTASITFVDLPSKRLYDFSSHNFKVYPPKVTLDFITSPGGIGMFNTCSESCHRNGRGSRNFSDTMDVAPAFGTNDGTYGQWVNKADKDLADSLWRYYQLWWPDSAVSGIRVSSHRSTSSGIVSVAPNPARQNVAVTYDVPHPGPVTIVIYTITGARVRTLVDYYHNSGQYRREWNGADDQGHVLPPGVYLMRMLGPDGAQSAEQVILSR